MERRALAIILVAAALRVDSWQFVVVNVALLTIAWVRGIYWTAQRIRAGESIAVVDGLITVLGPPAAAVAVLLDSIASLVIFGVFWFVVVASLHWHPFGVWPRRATS